MQLIAHGELSHAARMLKTVDLTLSIETILAQLTNTDLRPRRLLCPIPDDILNYHPDVDVELDRNRFLTNLRNARRGLSPSLSGGRNEHYKVVMDDEHIMGDLYTIASRLACGNVPRQIGEALRMCKLTALPKSNGKIRGLNAGDTFRRLVAKTLAQQYEEEFRNATSPFNFGMAVHSGVDAVIHCLRTLSSQFPNGVITKIDGVGAFDHILRARMLSKLRSLPTAHRLLPFVLLSYGSPSTYLWRDAAGAVYSIPQGEGGEQGDPLMPALFCLGLHDALAQAQSSLQEGEYLFAYLDDIYLFTSRERARPAYDAVSSAIRDLAGIDVNQGKTEAWSKNAQPAPPAIATLNSPDPNVPPVWKSDLSIEQQGLVILGSPLGSPEFIRAQCQKRLQEEEDLWNSIITLPSLQSAWVLLLFCGAPRANHVFRTVPPFYLHDYAVLSSGQCRNFCSFLLNA